MNKNFEPVEWHVALKMASEGTPMHCEKNMVYIEKQDGRLVRVCKYSGDVIGSVDLHENFMTNRYWEPYVKKLQLTDDEKVILRNLPKKFKWIARDKTLYTLFVYEKKPEKRGISWTVDSGRHAVFSFEHIFSEIKWEDTEPWLIEDLLK